MSFSELEAGFIHGSGLALGGRALKPSLRQRHNPVNQVRRRQSSRIRSSIEGLPNAGAILDCQLPTNLITAEMVGSVESSMPVWLLPAELLAGPFISVFNFLLIVRVILSWYPDKDLNKLPWNLAAWPTEPLLSRVRKVIPPQSGVDVSPIAVFAILSLAHELLVGPQGILTLIRAN